MRTNCNKHTATCLTGINLKKSTGYLTAPACDMLKITDRSRLVLTLRDKKLYMAVEGIDNTRGSVALMQSRRQGLIFSLPLSCSGIPMGFYEIGEPEFNGDMDFYELKQTI